MDNIFQLWEVLARFVKGTGFYASLVPDKPGSEHYTSVSVANWNPIYDLRGENNGPDTAAMYELLKEAGYNAFLTSYMFHPDMWVIRVTL